MKVSELIKVLQECDPNGDVNIGYEADNPMDSMDVCDVLEIKYPGKNVATTVVIRA